MLLENISLSSLQDKLLQDPNFKMGFELEFVTPEKNQFPRGYVAYDDDDNRKEYVVKTKSEQNQFLNFARKNNLEIEREFHYGTRILLDENLKKLGYDIVEHNYWRNTGKWYFSSEDIPGSPELGFELRSPILSLEEGINAMERVFNWIQECGYITTEGTGFHIGISYSGKKSKNPNFLKLLLFLDEDYLLRQFGRRQNTFTKPHLSDVLYMTSGEWSGIWFMKRVREIGNLIQDEDKFKQEVRKFADEIENLPFIKPTEDYHEYAVNFNKLQSRYLEFRIIGGKNYHLKIEKIKRTLAKYILSYHLAYNPNLFKEKYYQLFERFLLKNYLKLY